jgi:hypothetical protein
MLQSNKQDLHGFDEKSQRHILKEEDNNRSGSEHLTELKSSISIFQFAGTKRLPFERNQTLSKTIVRIVILSE